MKTNPHEEITHRRWWTLERLGRLVLLNLLLGLGYALLAQTERVTLTLKGEWMEQTNAQILDLAVSGDIACLAGGPVGLVVFDLSDPTQPRPVSQYPESPSRIPGIAMSGHYAYLTMLDRLQILDLSNPAQPVPVGAYTNPAVGVAVQGSTAYVVGTNFSVLDVSNPAHPTLMGTCPVGGSHVAVSGHIACVITGIDSGNDDYSMLTVIDLTDPSHPVGRGTLKCDHTGVSILGNFAYLTDWNEDFSGWIIDLTDLDQPRRVEWFGGLDAAIDGHYAFVTDDGLHVLDIANPTQPPWRTSAESFGVHVAVSGDLVCVAGLWNPSLQVFRISRTRLPEIAVQMWTNRYHGPENLDDAPRAIAIDAHGDVVVTGFTASVHAGTNHGDFYTAKYAGTNGGLLWERRHSSSTHLPEYPGFPWENDFTLGLALDAAGNVVVTGASQTNSSWHAYTAKYAAADGRILWEQRYGAMTDAVRHMAIAIDAQGNTIVTGQYYRLGRTPLYRVKYAAADGAILWQHERDQLGFSLGAVAVVPQGDVFIAGDAACPPGSGSICLYIAKYAAATGNLLWEQYHYGRGHPDYGGLAVDQEGNLVVSVFFDADEAPRTYTAKYAGTNGTVIWERLGGPPVDNCPPLLDSAGNVVIVGGGDLYDMAKYAAANGATLWECHPPPPDFSAFGAAIDGAGDVIVVGRVNYDTNAVPFCTSKYSGADGSLLWEKRCDLGAWACAVAVDTRSDIFVTGAGLGSQASLDFLTVKYLTVPAAVLGPPQPSPQGIGLSFAAKPGLAYAMERAENLTNAWTRIGAVLVGTNGLGALLDAQSPTDRAFYRVVYPQPAD